MYRISKLTKSVGVLFVILGLLLLSFTPINGIVNKKRVNFLDGKSISYFLNHPKIDRATKMFYQGELVVLNDLSNCTFIDSVLTKSDETRPFYFYVFNSLVNSSIDVDGRIADNCLLYIEQYPCQFFAALNSADFDINVVKWTNGIGVKLSDPQTYQRFKSTVDSKMAECNENADLWISFFSEARKSRIR